MTARRKKNARSRAPLRKVLVANRGEIAVRIEHALAELGMTSVAVYSEPDRAAPHVLAADEAYAIGPGPAAESYLRIDRILEAARRAGADAIHPGYGFLSENADFAQAVEEAGLVFVGPPAAAMAKMGNKIEARRLLQAAGVPVVPGGVDAVRGLEEAGRIAKEIGYPVLLKAAAGGGGKGMRVVRSEKELPTALELTCGEARSAFGDDAVFVERYIESPRHVEVQVLADAHGNCIHLFERECSIQRRHQKVVEESPSPSIDDDVRVRLSEAAVRAARSAHYVNAGTVEFLLDEEDRFYFLEMNTRLQVEHPLTEEVVGVDLVAAQLDIAAGRPLPWRQEDLHQRGHAIEFRLYAEDPVRAFAPSAGTIQTLRTASGPGVRNDLGIREGYAVPVHYDPLMAKLIVRGETRQQALQRSRRALRDTCILGLAHNLPLHRWIVQQPDFVAGSYSTRFLEDHFDPEALSHSLSAPEKEVLAAALALVASGAGDASARADAAAPPLSAWGRLAREGLTNTRTGRQP